VEEHGEDEECADGAEDRRRIGLDAEPARDRVEAVTPDRQPEQDDAGQQPQQRVALAETPRANQLEHNEEQQEGRDRRSDRNGKWCHRRCSSSSGTA
jgi:hypothetical protein